MKIFDVIVLIGIIAIIMLGAVFSQGMFMNLSLEGAEITNTTSTLAQYGQTYAWIYVIAALLIIAVLVMALKVFRETVPT